MEEDGKQDNFGADGGINSLAVLGIHKARVKQDINLSISEIFFTQLTRSLSFLAWYLSAFLIADKDYWTSIFLPIIISESCIIVFTIAFSKPKSKSFLPSSTDLTKITESAIIIGCCLKGQFVFILFCSYLVLCLVSWILLFFKFYKSITETYTLKLVSSCKQIQFIFDLGVKIQVLLLMAKYLFARSDIDIVIVSSPFVIAAVTTVGFVVYTVAVMPYRAVVICVKKKDAGECTLVSRSPPDTPVRAALAG